jgi:acetyltransferase
MAEDSQFGPVILFGHGGTAAEVIGDKAIALAPLNLALAEALMARTRVHRLLKGYRNQPPAALEAIALTLVKVSQLVVDLAEVAELDINPLLADAEGVVALDARIRVRRAETPGTARLAIRPYPSELEEEVELAGGRRFVLRPVRPEDSPALIRFFEKLTPEDVRMRFFAAMKALSPAMVARLTQIDYEREMALVLTEPGRPSDGAEIYGVARICADPDNETAEFAIIVRSDMKAHGLGTFLMRRIIDYARARGLRRLYGVVLRENEAMLRLCRVFGFTIQSLPENPAIFEARLELQASASSRA